LIFYWREARSAKREARKPAGGFTNAEGSFIILISKSLTSRLGEKVVLRFSIAQHSRDEVLMRSLIEYLGACAVVILILDPEGER
jgi:hypothetical protein